MDRDKMNRAVSALRALFDEDEIPRGFSHEGQSFDERCEAWLAHAVEELEAEIEAFDAAE
jgi:hypothetical protein